MAVTDGLASSPADDWPEPAPEQVRVLLLGCYHMDNPGLDEVNVDADDVLGPDRQAELRALVDRLAGWAPDRVAVERPYERREAVNALYREYHDGERAYDEEQRVDPLHPERSDPTAECRSEVVQVGFRLADRFRHERVYPIDEPTDLGNEDAAELEERGFDPERKVPVGLPDFAAHERESNRRLASSTVTEYLRWINREEHLRFNHEGMFGRYLRWGEGDNYGGPRALATWYDRNIRMAHHLWRAVERGDDRVLVVVGSGHVRVLRHLLGESPQFCPVDPLKLLDG